MRPKEDLVILNMFIRAYEWCKILFPALVEMIYQSGIDTMY